MSRTDGAVGVIGLGAMGGPIARRLATAGWEVHGCDMDAARREALSAAGGSVVERPAELPERCATFLVVLPNPAITRAALFGEGGLAEGSAPLAAGDVVVNLGTIGPDAVLELASALSERGAELLDVPMGKSSQAAEEGTLSLMASGSEEAIDALRPLFERFATDITFCGELGVASTVKLVNNLVSAGILEAVAEGLPLGAKAGAPLELMVDVLSRSGADCWHLRNTFGERVARRQFAAGFSVDLATKDLKLGLDVAHGKRMPMPVLAGAYERFLEAQAAGLGAEDWATLAKLSERHAGVELAGARASS